MENHGLGKDGGDNAVWRMAVWRTSEIDGVNNDSGEENGGAEKDSVEKDGVEKDGVENDVFVCVSIIVNPNKVMPSHCRSCDAQDAKIFENEVQQLGI